MASLKQSTTYTRMFLLVDSTDHTTGKTGVTPTVTLSKAGAAFGAAAGTVSEVSSGWYKIALTTADTNTLGELAYHATGASCDATDFVDQVSARLADDLATPTNITAGTITTVTNLTNAPTAGDLTATMKTSVTTAATAATPTAAAVTGSVGGNVTGSVGSVVGAVGSVTGAVGSVTGNVGGNVVGTVASVVGAVGSVTGSVGGNVTGSVGSVAAGGIAAASFAAGAIDATAIATDAIGANEVSAAAVTKIQAGLSTYAGGDTAGTTTLLSRLTAIRAALLDNLDAAISSRLASASYTAAPTANQNADALLDRADAVEVGATPRQSFRLMLAALAGKLSGAATNTTTIRNAVADSKDRIVATVDADGNRTAVTTDVS